MSQNYNQLKSDDGIFGQKKNDFVCNKGNFLTITS